MIEGRIEISFRGFKGNAENQNWGESFMDKIILPKFKFDENVFKEIGKVIKDKQEKNLYYGYDIRGGMVKPKKQPSKYGGWRIFLNRGILFDSIEMESSINRARVFISANRSQIAYWLCTGTKKMVARPFFGLNRELKEDILKILKRQIYGNN